MKVNIQHTCFALFYKSVILLLLISLLSCGNGNGNAGNSSSADSNAYITDPGIRDRNNELDGDDTRQPSQDQDSVNRVINRNGGKQLDTLH
jgi:hypothetical protein